MAPLLCMFARPERGTCFPYSSSLCLLPEVPDLTITGCPSSLLRAGPSLPLQRRLKQVICQTVGLLLIVRLLVLAVDSPGLALSLRGQHGVVKPARVTQYCSSSQFSISAFQTASYIPDQLLC